MTTQIKTGRIGRKKFNKTLFVFACLGALFLAVFAYAPMFGLLLAFKDGDFKISLTDAILRTDWVGLRNFSNFLKDRNFWDVMVNTLGLNVLMLFINFPAPILFALLLNEVLSSKLKRTVQTICIFPHFISWIIFGGIIIAMTDMTTGIFNPILYALGLSSPDDPVNLQTAEFFWAEMIIASLVKGVGWGSIVYLAAIAGIDREMYEAAILDGANRFQKAIHMTLPSIAPTITVFFLLNVSNLLDNSFEQFYSLQNAVNLEKSEVLSTYLYKTGLQERRYSYSTAMSLFNSLIAVVLLVTGNTLSKKLTDRGLF